MIIGEGEETVTGSSPFQVNGKNCLTGAGGGAISWEMNI